jgi:3-isopropylmalate dehydrogenase
LAHRVGIIAGDGIGQEVVPEALKVVRAAGVELDTVEYDLGGSRYLRTGEVLPDAVLDELRGLDAILLGAVGTPEVPPGVIERGLLLRLRFELDLYVNLRPMEGATIDCVVVRENTEGSYAGEGGALRKGTPHEVATQGSVNTRFGVERCLRFAFELAQSRPRRHLTLVHKTNVPPSPATSGSARATRWLPSTPTSPPRTTTSTPRASTWSSGPSATT